jgi:arabinose-5-phosphate isomerase
LASTLSCNGRPAAFIHAGEALHGDFGAIQKGDVVVACSNSGKTDEVIQVADKAKHIGAILILITGTADSEIAKKADVVLCYGSIKEACPLGLTPTTSILVMMALCDSLSMAVQKVVGLSYETYASNHHAGYLGGMARSLSNETL